ncbi:hypothetical protein HDU76_009686, partial [Blyttiomyces sp. JEL0837]
MEGIQVSGSGFTIGDKTHGEFGGSGLGLNIAKQLVELMGGQMEDAIQSDLETIYAFKIPCEQTPLKPITAPSHRRFKLKSNLGLLTESSAPVAPKPAKEDKKHLLVVDDNDINRKILIKHLSRHGFTMDEAVNGSEAVKLAKVNEYGMILMDIEMPIMNGLDATLEIRKWEKQRMEVDGGGGGGDGGCRIPIVAVTGNARSEQVELYLKSGMQAVLVKPYTKDGLMEL